MLMQHVALTGRKRTPKSTSKQGKGSPHQLLLPISSASQASIVYLFSDCCYKWLLHIRICSSAFRASSEHAVNGSFIQIAWVPGLRHAQRWILGCFTN